MNFSCTSRIAVRSSSSDEGYIILFDITVRIISMCRETNMLLQEEKWRSWKYKSSFSTKRRQWSCKRNLFTKTTKDASCIYGYFGVCIYVCTYIPLQHNQFYLFGKKSEGFFYAVFFLHSSIVNIYWPRYSLFIAIT